VTGKARNRQLTNTPDQRIEQLYSRSVLSPVLRCSSV
jgi:hypothetical protein